MRTFKLTPSLLVLLLLALLFPVLALADWEDRQWEKNQSRYGHYGPGDNGDWIFGTGCVDNDGSHGGETSGYGYGGALDSGRCGGGGRSRSSAPPTCSVTFDQNPLTGSFTKVRWTSQNASLFYINSIGYVGASGKAQISSPGDYSGTVSGAGGTVSCPATLAGPDGTLASNNDITRCSGGDSGTPAAKTCRSDGNLRDTCNNTTDCKYGCSTATNRCNTATICPAGSGWNSQTQACVDDDIVQCPTGFILQNGQCVRVSCPEGWTLSGNLCIPPPTFFFTSFDAFDRNENPFRATGHLQTFPALVRQGDTSRIYWKVSNAKNCTVTGSNGDGGTGSASGVWDTLFSGAPGKTTNPITSQTTYTLLCTALPGATPSTVQESATVNILPFFQEL